MADQRETHFKTEFMKHIAQLYPSAHAMIIPASPYRLLPYDLYVFYKTIFRAIELKVDDHPVEAHQYHALYQVASNCGYAFTIRFNSKLQSFTVENFTNGHTQTFGTERSVNHQKRLIDVIKYIMSFEVSPIEAEVQAQIKRNFEATIKDVLDRKGSRS